MSTTLQATAGSPATPRPLPPLKAAAQPIPDQKDAYHSGGASDLPEYWQPNLGHHSAAAVQGLLQQAMTAHPIADVSQLNAMPAGTWIVSAQRLMDGFVKYDLHETSGPVRTGVAHVNSTGKDLPYASFNTSRNYNAITPDGQQFSGGHPALAENAPFTVYNPQDDTRLAVVDPQVGQALFQQTGPTKEGFGFVDPSSDKPLTLGQKLGHAAQGVANIGHTLHDAVTLPYDLVHASDDE